MKTLKLSLLLFAALVISKTSKAQTPFTFGVKGGANYSNIYGDPASTNRKGKVGVVVGAFARIGDRLYVEPGANFSSYGAKFDFNAQKYDVKFNQLQVPILVGYKFIKQDGFNVHAALGPELDFSLKKPIAVQTYAYKNQNLAGKLEAGVDIGNLTVDMAYVRGLNKINKTLDQKVGMYSLTLGFRFL